ncbi:MAG: hypothetical protein WA871_08685 [Candidatus Acidiferrales bacterium]
MRPFRTISPPVEVDMAFDKAFRLFKGHWESVLLSFKALREHQVCGPTNVENYHLRILVFVGDLNCPNISSDHLPITVQNFMLSSITGECSTSLAAALA